MTTKDKTCIELVHDNLNSRMEDITKLWEMYKDDLEASDPDLGSFNDYGLSVDYVPHDEESEGGSVYNDEGGYIRYQLSWGGPSDEFRFFIDAELKCYKIEYWFLNWGDGAKAYPNKEQKSILMEIFQDWADCDSIRYWVDKAGE